MCRSFTYVEASGRDLKRNDGTFRFLLLFDEVALIPSETADNKTSLLTDYSYSLVAFAELPLVQSRSIQKIYWWQLRQVLACRLLAPNGGSSVLHERHV